MTREMSGRRLVQQAHERAQVAILLRWFNHCYRSHFEVVEEPISPEAIIKSGSTVRWVEVGTAFWNNEYAKDEYSYATPDEAHRPIGNGPFMNVDAAFSQRFVAVVKKKLEKRSYLASKAKYGPGYLIVPILFPLFDKNTLRLMRHEWMKTAINDLGCFRGIFVSHPSLNERHVRRWPIGR